MPVAQFSMLLWAVWIKNRNGDVLDCSHKATRACRAETIEEKVRQETVEHPEHFSIQGTPAEELTFQGNLLAILEEGSTYNMPFIETLSL